MGRLAALFFGLSLSGFGQQFLTSYPTLICRSASASSTAYSCSATLLFSGAAGIPSPILVNWTPDVTNTTTSPTLNLGSGPLNVKDLNGQNVLIGALVAGSVYSVSYDGTTLRVLAGAAIIPATAALQQSLATICFDVNGAHTTAFSCSRSPAGAPLTRGSQILFGFAGTTNGANPTLDVEGTGGGGIVLSDSSSIPAGSIAGDAAGTTNYYLLLFDADNDNWVFANQLLPDLVAPAVTGCGTGATVSGTDRSGTVTEGTLATGCTLTFHAAYPFAARCAVSSQAGLVFTYSTTTTALTVVNVGALSTTKFSYVCAR